MVPARISYTPDLFDDAGAVYHRHDSAGSIPDEAAAKDTHMATKDQMFPSKYLKASDLNGRSVTLEIKSAPEEMLTGFSGQQEKKTVLYFTTSPKKLPLNKTNFEAVVDVTGEADSDHWPGHRIEVYSVSTDKGPGVRIRTPAVRPAAMAGKPRPAVADDHDDEIPFNDEIPDFSDLNR
jgi:hypothetical protein